ncbi:MAG: sigma-70 family RNA polymerase sigma factor [Gammaproteobacteria bacterium]|nr:sigma-70 family RNA polymerase sigma factor [Gammaproteobacteria bacterium]MBV9619697.1 sigma-70 family RNA polymerase sigma factor [Gammaproteobacteria bacterium]
MGEDAEADAQLLRRYAGGEAAAFERLYQRHERRVWHYLLRNVRNRALAEELLQEVWFAVARAAPQYQPTARFTTWLFTIAHHHLVDALRRERRSVSLETLGMEADGFPGEERAEPFARAAAAEQGGALARALAQLPGEQRDALLLQMEGGLSVEEVAALTGCGFETAKSRLRYARARLRELLSECA